MKRLRYLFHTLWQSVREQRAVALVLMAALSVLVAAVYCLFFITII